MCLSFFFFVLSSVKSVNEKTHFEIKKKKKKLLNTISI